MINKPPIESSTSLNNRQLHLLGNRLAATTHSVVVFPSYHPTVATGAEKYSSSVYLFELLIDEGW